MSMRSVFLDVQFDFSTAARAALSEKVLLRTLGLVSVLNHNYLVENPGTPKLYSREAGIRYCPPDQADGAWIDRLRVREFARVLQSFGMDDERAAIILRLVAGAEIFQDVRNLYRRKRGDCDRLVCARIAELWLAGLMASPYLIPFSNDRGGTTYHAVVLHADGTTEDPSLILGMGGEARAAARAEEIRKNCERRDNLLRAAAEVMVVDGVSPEALGAVVDAAAYVPRGGFRQVAA